MTGVPVVAAGLADSVKSAIFVLLGAALLLMAATLALVFRARLRLLPLALALAAAAMTFGALSVAGGDLTMASIAALPVLIGLAVDYAIQFQARYNEAVARGRGRARCGGRRRGRAHHSHRRARDGHRLPGAAPVARAHGARLRSPAGGGHRARARLRPVRGLRGARALPAPRARGGRRAPRGSARSPCRTARAPARPRGGRVARGPLLADPGLFAVEAAAGAGDRAGGRRGGPCARHPERGGLGRARARAAKPPGAEGRERAPGGDGRLRRDRRDDSRRRHHRPEGDRVDDALPGPGAEGARLPPRQALHPGPRNPPELCPALSLPDLFSAARRWPGAGAPPARRRARVLLAGSGDGRPQDRQPRLRNPAHAARPPEGGGRRHQVAPEAARGRRGVRGRPAGARGRGQRRALLTVAARAHARRSARGRVPRAARWPAALSVKRPFR